MGIFNFFKKNKNKEENPELENREPENETAEDSDFAKTEESEESSESEDKSEEENSDETEIAETDETGETEIGVIEDLEDDSEQISSEQSEELADITENLEEIDEEEIEDVQEIFENENSSEKIFETEEVSESKETEETDNSTESEEIADTEEGKPKKVNFFQKIISGLDKTRKNIIGNIENVLKGFTKIDEELYEELEEALILADIGVDTSLEIISVLREKVREEKIQDMDGLKIALVTIITNILTDNETESSENWEITSPTVMLVMGVNGVGKTTTIGKLLSLYKDKGFNVLAAAADTFRAAAIDQLEVWGERSGVNIIRHQEGSDPAAVVFDALQAAKARKSDLLVIDTAGRLHNKKNLMDELNKIFRVIEREYPEANKEVILVLDATTGQNAMQQAKIFKETANITGLALTKLDGTAKGGIIIAIKNELDIPVRFIGVGEQIADLQPFDAEQFAKALFTVD